MMKKGAAMLFCFLMVSGGLALFAAGQGAGAGGPGSASPAAISKNAAAGATFAERSADAGPSDMVPSAPWSPERGADPFNGLNRSMHPKNSPAAVSGSAKVPVILVGFNDTTNSSTHTPSYYYDLLFNASKNSMNKYYKEASYNLFCTTGNVSP